ncbi:hypothetical protein [Lentzea kentuckyensis]|uniref:hypothetical protein n=1 Tax=Lentzea kentuckyensis TaxID=360086 RepID=UPI000A382CA5|nr:hypothetical protein [Lentzea kentuckyensis]
MVALLAVPVAGAVGSETYATHTARVEVEQKSRTQVDAVLVEDAPTMGGVLVKFAHLRIRLRWWQVEWELTAPDWTGR